MPARAILLHVLAPFMVFWLPFRILRAQPQKNRTLYGRVELTLLPTLSQSHVSHLAFGLGISEATLAAHTFYAIAVYMLGTNIVC